MKRSQRIVGTLMVTAALTLPLGLVGCEEQADELPPARPTPPAPALPPADNDTGATTPPAAPQDEPGTGTGHEGH